MARRVASPAVTRIWQQLQAKPYVWVVALAVVLRLPTFTTRLFDADEGAIGVQGMVVRSGGVLYRDIFDRKPPLPPLAYAASFWLTDSTDIRLMRVLVTLFLALGGLLVAHDAFRRHGTTTAAWWGGTLFVAGAMAFFPADAGAANYAHFALLPGTAALLWTRRAHWGWALAGGVALGLAILTRQSWLLASVAAIYSAQRVGRWRNPVLVLVSAAVTVGTTALYAPFDAFWEWNVTNSPGFVFAGAGIFVSVGRGLVSSMIFVGFHLAAVVGLWWSVRRRNPFTAAGREDRDLWLWLLTGLAAAAAGFRFFGHYWMQVLPPVVVLATPMLTSLSGTARRRALAATAVGGAFAFALLFVPGSFHHRPDPADLAGYLRAHTTDGESVFVWGSYPEVLVRAERLPAGALVHTDFVTGRSGGRQNPEETLPLATPGALDLMMDHLRADPPKLVLDTSTALGLGYRHYPLTLIPEVEAFVTSGYHRVDVVDGVTVWQRNL
jgi:hypothetical protein